MKKRLKLLIPLLLAGLTSAQNIAFTDVNVFDGEQLLPATTVVVQDGLISAIGPDAAIPEGTEVIDGSGQTLLPGLIDAHQHVFMPQALVQNLVFGVTSVLDMFTAPQFATAMRDEQEAGQSAYRADLFSAGVLATAPDGHGTQFGVQVDTLTDPAQADAWVEARVNEGSDYIKVIIESGEEMGMELPTLDQELAEAVTTAAHDRDMLVITHVQSLDAAKQALAAGTDGLGHIFTDEVADEEFVAAAVEAGLFVVPTMTVFQSLPDGTVDESLIEDEHLAPFMSDQDRLTLSQPFGGFDQLSKETGIESIRVLHEAGVPILAGTDAMNPGTTYGASLHRELELLTEAGLTPAEALASATSVTADVFGLDDRGRVTEGLRADLVLVNGDPTEDIRNTRQISGVWKDGVRADREGWSANIAAQAQEAEERAAAISGDEPVLISDFETGDLTTTFGQAWVPTDDSPAGGDSTASIAVTEGGADGSGHALQVDGTVGPAFVAPWSGTMFMPAAVPFAPANLSELPVLSFDASGTPGEYRVQLYCANLGQQQVVQWEFPVEEDWNRVEVDLGTIGGCDPSGVMAIIITSGTIGDFTLRLDNVAMNPAD